MLQLVYNDLKMTNHVFIIYFTAVPLLCQEPRKDKHSLLQSVTSLLDATTFYALRL